ncbi:MAG: alkaline phosphatase PhoX [Gemmatimonadales bacterium]
MKWSRTLGQSIAVAAAVTVSACEPESPTTPDSLGPLEPTALLDLVDPGAAVPFPEVPASAPCVAGGTAQQIILPQNYVYSVVATEGPAFPDLPDMNTLNEGGPHAYRFLYRTHETGSNGAVSVTDLVTGVTSIVAQRADWERFDGIAWTPWNTILAAEETSAAALKDPMVPEAVAGLVYEIDPSTGAAEPLPAVGSRAHEGLRFDKHGNLYGISETGPGYIYKFVPNRRRSLSSGDLYALRIVQDAGNRTGAAQWVLLDPAASRVNSLTEAAAKGATGYARPEDVEIGTSTGNDRRGNDILFVAVTGEDRVLAIDLDPPGNSVQAYVTDYVREGLNAPADFDLPDNLALDQFGNLYITEDPGGTAGSGKAVGDDVWFAPYNAQTGAQSLPIMRFMTISDCDAEPTGIYVSKTGKTLFVNIQHRGGSDPRDQAVAIQRRSDVRYSVVDAMSEF